MEYGTLQGLAYRLNENNLLEQDRYANELQRRGRIAAEAKSKALADDWAFNNAMNPHDNPLVKEFAKNQVLKVGQYLSQNPDWEINPAKRVVYNTMIRELRDNPDLNRGLLSDGAYKEWQKDLAEKSKNPDLFNAKANEE